MNERSAPPAPAPDDPCAYGCSPSTGWRWYPTGWERACDAHRGGRLVARRAEFVPDIANITRQEQT